MSFSASCMYVQIDQPLGLSGQWSLVQMDKTFLSSRLIFIFFMTRATRKLLTNWPFLFYLVINLTMIVNDSEFKYQSEIIPQNMVCPLLA